MNPTTTLLPVVPMFHANAWGLVYAAPMCGAKLVFPGPKLDGASVYELLDKEQVTLKRRRADGVARPARVLRPEQVQDVVGQAHS